MVGGFDIGVGSKKQQTPQNLSGSAGFVCMEPMGIEPTTS